MRCRRRRACIALPLTNNWIVTPRYMFIEQVLTCLLVVATIFNVTKMHFPILQPRENERKRERDYPFIDKLRENVRVV